MGLDDTINLDRLATAFEKIAAALTTLVTIEEKRFAKRYPERAKREVQVNTPDSERRDQLSDKASPDWFEETEQALPESRFAKRLRETNPKAAEAKPAPPKRRTM